MTKYFMTAAALATITAQAQVSGPNRPGPGTSPGTFQTPSTKPGTPSSFDTLNPPVSDIPTARTQSPGSLSSGATVIQPNGPLPGVQQNDPQDLRTRSQFPSSRDWETNSVGGPGENERGSESGRLTPPPDVNPRPTPLQGGSVTTSPIGGSNPAPGGASTLPTPTTEQPFDRALSAKIRAQLSHDPQDAKQGARISPEAVRDLRIQSQNGKIILEGAVSSQAEKDAIALRAKGVQGVAGVENRLRVKSQNSGAPAAGEAGRSGSPIDPKLTPGQTPQNDSDLNDSHPEITPDK